MFSHFWSGWGNSKSVNRLHKRHRRSCTLFIEPLETRELMAGDLSSILGLGTDVGRNVGHEAVTDSAGNTYIAGTLDTYNTATGSPTNSTAPIDIDPAHTYADNRDIVAVPDGGSLAYFAKFLADGTLDWVVEARKNSPRFMGQLRIAVAPSTGGIYFAGLFSGTLNFGSQSLTAGGPFPWRFAGKIDLNGDVSWATGYAAALPDPFLSTTGLAVDELRSRLFVSGAQMLTNPGNTSGTIIALNFANPLNVQIAWKADLVPGTLQGARLRDITVDSAGNVVTVGNFAGTADFDPGSGKTNLSSGGGKNPAVANFIWKLTGNGSFAWVKQFEAGKNSGWDAIAVAIDPADATNSIYVAGSFSGTVDFQPGSGAVNLTSSAGSNAYLVRMSQTGTVAYARQFGGTGEQVARSIAFDATGVYLLGGDGTPNGSLANVFVARLNKVNGTPTWQTAIYGQLNIYGYGQIEAYGLAVNSATNQVHVLGTYQGTIQADSDLDPELSSGDTTDDLLWFTLNIL